MNGKQTNANAGLLMPEGRFKTIAFNLLVVAVILVISGCFWFGVFYLAGMFY